KSGMLARVRVVDASPTEAIFVPAEAVEAIQAGSQVIVVRDGNPAPRAVKTGESFGDSIEITSGLAPGDTILVPRPRK
ncbi:MAG: hypothetical protein K8T20_13030, partial [Planctomycetes bacterium]|nr:hypothetical protein [Planctomycetota bacterium]